MATAGRVAKKCFSGRRSTPACIACSAHAGGAAASCGVVGEEAAMWLAVWRGEGTTGRNGFTPVERGVRGDAAAAVVAPLGPVTAPARRCSGGWGNKWTRRIAK